MKCKCQDQLRHDDAEALEVDGLVTVIVEILHIEHAWIDELGDLR